MFTCREKASRMKESQYSREASSAAEPQMTLIVSPRVRFPIRPNHGKEILYTGQDDPATKEK